MFPHTRELILLRVSAGQLLIVSSINITEVGGQRGERKKWIHCFERVTVIVYCAALSDYDQALTEDNNKVCRAHTSPLITTSHGGPAFQNRMAESLILFDAIVNSRWFLRTSVVLLLNKVDIFRHKLRNVSNRWCLSHSSPGLTNPKVPLEQYFSEYTGGPNADKASKYILWRFTQANRAKLTMYPQSVSFSAL